MRDQHPLTWDFTIPSSSGGWGATPERCRLPERQDAWSRHAAPGPDKGASTVAASSSLACGGNRWRARWPSTVASRSQSTRSPATTTSAEHAEHDLARRARGHELDSSHAATSAPRVKPGGPGGSYARLTAQTRNCGADAPSASRRPRASQVCGLMTARWTTCESKARPVAESRGRSACSRGTRRRRRSARTAAASPCGHRLLRAIPRTSVSSLLREEGEEAKKTGLGRGPGRRHAAN